MRKEFSERFWSQVNKGEGCWRWTGAKTGGGYGSVWFPPEQRVVSAARASWVMHNGPASPDLYVCHHCDTPSCVRPDHLFLATQSENMRDCVRKGRKNPPIGERAGSCKLTESQAIAVLTRVRAGENQHAIAREFGISASHVCLIGQRRKWKHLP